jgi:hypothetical protein
VEAARHRRGIIAGERHAERVGRAVRLLGGEHAADRLLALGERALEQRAPRGDRGRLEAHLVSFRPKLAQRAVRRRDRALGFAQAVARLLADLLFLLQFPRQRLDAAAKRLQVFFVACRDGVAAPEREEKADERQE